MTFSLESAPRLRRAVYVPLVAALAAAAAVFGAGIGSAHVETGAPYGWRVHNFTDQTLTAGDFHRDEGAGYGSALAFGGSTPWAALQPGDHAGTYQPRGRGTTRTWGKVCYRGQIWNMPRSSTDGLTWIDMYVFAMDDGIGGKKLMVTHEKGGWDIDMNAYGEPC